MPEYFTLEEFRSLPDMNNASLYDDDTVERAAAYIVAVIERVVGTSFVAREVTETIDGSGVSGLVLKSPYVQSLTAVTTGGTTIDTADLIHQGGVVRNLSGVGWTAGIGNTTITYESGYSSEPPADIKEAALQGTRARLLDTASNAKVNDRTSSITNDAGGTTSYVLAGVERPTGYPEVDAVILGWRDKLSGFGFA